MSQQIRPDQIAKKTIVYEAPRAEAVSVRKDHVYRAGEAGPMTMDVYAPSGAQRAARSGAVVFVTGYPDAGAEKIFGCKQKEMGSYVSWARLVAASGLVAVTYTNHEPAADALAVIDHVRGDAPALGVDGDRIGLWSCSGSVPTALHALMRAQPRVRCAALCYGYTLDLDDSTRVAAAARQFGFANPARGRNVSDLPSDVPLFLARAGQDRMPGLNDALDRFIAEALRVNLPLTLVNHARGPHAFDLFDDSEASREIVRRVLSFLQLQLSA
jgi:hypothetical protein